MVTAATPSTRSRRGDRSLVVVALDADAHDGHRIRVELEDGRRVGVFRHAAADTVDARPDFVGRFVQIGAPGELQADVGVALGGGRIDLLEAGNSRHRLFDRARDQLLDLERAHAGVTHSHRDARKLAFRHQIDRKARQRDGAQEDHHEADHEHRDGTMNR
jgi:hypothetical protein